MKLKFKSFYQMNCAPNAGIQYFTPTDIPFKVGDYVKFTHAGKQNFKIIANKISRVTKIFRNDGGNHNMLILLNTQNNSLCCSWVTPLNSTWNRL